MCYYDEIYLYAKQNSQDSWDKLTALLKSQNAPIALNESKEGDYPWSAASQLAYERNIEAVNRLIQLDPRSVDYALIGFAKDRNFRAIEDLFGRASKDFQLIYYFKMGLLREANYFLSLNSSFLVPAIYAAALGNRPEWVGTYRSTLMRSEGKMRSPRTARNFLIAGNKDAAANCVKDKKWILIASLAADAMHGNEKNLKKGLDKLDDKLKPQAVMEVIKAFAEAGRIAHVANYLEEYGDLIDWNKEREAVATVIANAFALGGHVTQAAFYLKRAVGEEQASVSDYQKLVCALQEGLEKYQEKTKKRSCFRSARKKHLIDQMTTLLAEAKGQNGDNLKLKQLIGIVKGHIDVLQEKRERTLGSKVLCFFKPAANSTLIDTYWKALGVLPDSVVKNVPYARILPETSTEDSGLLGCLLPTPPKLSFEHSGYGTLKG